MEKCVIDLYSAVTQIDLRYYQAIGTRENQTHYPQSIEASFTTEMYHRFKSIMELPINASYYQNLILHYDITKLAAINGRPDLVLHQAQENRNSQRMFIEVKTDDDADLTDDFRKLKIATEPYLHFDNAIIVIANRPFLATKQLIIQNFQDVPFQRRAKLFLINAEIQPAGTIDYNLYQFTSIPNHQ